MVDRNIARACDTLRHRLRQPLAINSINLPVIGAFLALGAAAYFVSGRSIGSFLHEIGSGALAIVLALEVRVALARVDLNAALKQQDELPYAVLPTLD